MVEKKIPMRQCTGCREMKSKMSMIRVLKTAESGEIIIDLKGKVNGRGAYICKDAECLEKAFKCKGLERSLKTEISDEIKNQLRREMEKLG